RTGRPDLELGVSLCADDERVDFGRVFDELHQVAVRRGSGDPQPAFGKLVAVRVVDLVAVPGSLGHLRRPVGLGETRTRLELRGIGPQPHGPAQMASPATPDPVISTMTMHC